MASAATYRVGRSDFFTPGDLDADAQTVNAQVDAFDNAMDGNTISPQDWFDAWNVWLAQWRYFFKDKFSGGYLSDIATALNDSNRDDLVRYETQLEEWIKQGTDYGIGLPPGSRVTPSSGSGDSIDNHLKGIGLPDLNTIALLVTVLGGAYALWKFAK